MQNLLFPDMVIPDPVPIVVKPIAVGDRIKRKPRKYSAYSEYLFQSGTVLEIDTWHRAKIKWDEKAATGQQHSTINIKYLVHE